jgi:hypothetical protein
LRVSCKTKHRPVPQRLRLESKPALTAEVLLIHERAGVVVLIEHLTPRRNTK